MTVFRSAGGERSPRAHVRRALLVVIVLGCLVSIGTVSGEVASGATTDLKATCVATGTATPKNLDGGPWLLHPGDRKSQTFTAEVEYRPLPAGCKGAFARTPLVRFQVQSPTSHSHWSDAGKYLRPRKSRDIQEEELEQLEEEREEQGKNCWVPIPGGEKDICRTDPKITDAGGIGEVFWRPPWKLHEPTYARHDPRLYRCTPGSGITHVRALFRSTITNVTTGMVIEQHVTIVPVRVKHYPGKGPMPKAWRGAVRGPC